MMAKSPRYINIRATRAVERAHRIARGRRRRRFLAPIHNVITQARHELGLLRVLQECTVVPSLLLIIVAILGTAARMANG